MYVTSYQCTNRQRCIEKRRYRSADKCSLAYLKPKVVTMSNRKDPGKYLRIEIQHVKDQ